MILLEKLRKELIDAVDTHAVIDRIASDFYERIEELKKTDPVFHQMLWEYETFREYFKAENEELNDYQTILLQDMEMAVEDEIDDSFDAVEDRKMEELKLPEFKDTILKDLKEQGILLAPGQKLTSDIIEELYRPAYEAYDAYKTKLYDRVRSLSPMKAYKRAETLKKQYRKDQGILFDEEDFLALYDERLEEERLMSLLMDRVKDVLRYNHHYILDISADPLPEETDEGPQNDRYDGVLVDDGDMRDQVYSYVSELMSEYTGRRILATENELSDESYWTTYGDDFQDMILSYVEARLEGEIRYLAEEKPEEWSAFQNLCKLSEEDCKDTDRFLLKCDKINYGLAQRVEDLWSRFCEKKLG